MAYKRLTREELDAVTGEPLPDRVAMSLMDAGCVIGTPDPTASLAGGAETADVASAGESEVGTTEAETASGGAGEPEYERPPTVA